VTRFQKLVAATPVAAFRNERRLFGLMKGFLIRFLSSKVKYTAEPVVR